MGEQDYLRIGKTFKIKILIVFSCVLLTFVFLKCTYNYNGKIEEKGSVSEAELSFHYPKFCEWFGHREYFSVVTIKNMDTGKIRKHYMIGEFSKEGNEIFVRTWGTNEKNNDIEFGSLRFNKDINEAFFETQSYKFYTE